MTARGARPPSAIGALLFAVAWAAPARAVDASAPGATPTVTATDQPVNIYERPRRTSAILGYFRPGEHLSVRSVELVTGAGPCPSGWVGVAPAGFVCVGADGVRRDDDTPHADPLLFVPGDRLPRQWGASLGGQRFRRAGANEHESTSPPALGNAGIVASGPLAASVHIGLFERQTVSGDAYFTTTDGSLVPVARVALDTPSAFTGVELSDGTVTESVLPLAWAKTTAAALFLYDNDRLTPTETTLAPHVHRQGTGRTFTVGRETYYELVSTSVLSPNSDESEEDEPPAVLTPSGTVVVRAADVAFIDAEKALPKGVADNEIWVSVSIKQQSLVVYRGLRPIFATLISSGKGGAAHWTPRGTFRVNQKHRTAEMIAAPRPEIGEEGYRFEEVPFVQYIVGGIALHGVYWHDEFGLPRSHGCINLSVHDAAWVFAHTEPALPPSWHGITRRPSARGTTVVIQ